MKKIILLLCCLYPVVFFAQAYRMSTQTKEEVGKLTADGLVFVERIEKVLDSNHLKLKQGEINIQNPAASELLKQGLRNNTTNTQERVREKICLSCYEQEWKDQFLEMQLIQAGKNYNRDSLYQQSATLSQAYASVGKKKNEQGVKPTVGGNKQRGNLSGYQLLERQLDALSSVPDFTVFRKLDYNFVVSRFGLYLQLTKGMAYKDQQRKDNTIIDTNVPGISIKKEEYLRVIYTVEEHPDWVGAFGEGVTEIKEVEIIGDPDLVIQLFVSYWRTKIYEEIPINGYITSKEVMSDYVVLSAVAPNEYKITITKGNMEMNYAKTFGLHEKINEG